MTEYIIKAADWAIDCNGDSLFKDAEEIVRCRDCRFYWSFRDKFEKTCHAITNMQIYTNPDEFCSRGAKRMERKEGCDA